MIKRLFILAIFVMVGGLLLGGVAVAADETTAGTIITAEGSENYIDYEDIAGNPKATIYGPTLEAIVQSIYGLNTDIGTPADQSTDPTISVFYVYRVYNQGNTSDAYSLSSFVNYSAGAGSAWTIQFIQDDNQDGVHQGGEVTVITSLTIAEEGDNYFFLEVQPPADAGSGSTATILVTAETSATPVGAYTGANGDSYGGPAYENDVTITNVEAPTLSLTRVATVDAPTGFSQQSDEHYHVPGGIVTITMTYSNTGASTAESVIIIDKVPTGHQAGHINATTSEVANMDVEASKGNATGWTVSYTITTEALTAAQRGYGNTAVWVLLGTIEADSDFWTKDTGTALPLTASYIKWEKPAIQTDDDNETLTWGYIIR
jgi:uncharacterized repeat protein (TIGR01451 family)